MLKTRTDLPFSPRAMDQLKVEVWAEARRRLESGVGKPSHRADWVRAHRRFLWPDLELDFQDHHYLEALYADEHPEIVVSKASQMGASEWAISDAIWACDAKAANVLYLLPSTGDVADFSTARIGMAIEASPYIAGIIGSTAGIESYRAAARDRSTLKRIRNRFFYLRHASVRPDGRAPHLKVAAIDLIIFDELDEIDRRAPAIAEKRLGHSALKWRRWISTPTLPDFGIDAMLQQSDHHRWHVKCGHCNTEQPLDPFVNLITDVDGAGRPTKWFHKKGSPEQPFVGCLKCGKELDRVGAGQWIPSNPDSDIRGYHLNRLVSPRVDLYQLIKKGQTYDETERKEWWNQDLGLPYQPRGGGFHEGLLRQAERPYRMPIGDDRCMMGVDIGAVLHVVIRKFATDPEGKRVRQAVFIGEASFEDLNDLVERYDVRMTVMDALPEKHKAMEWTEKHEGRAKVAYYATGKAGSKRSEAAREKPADKFTIEIDRTRYFDGLRGDYLAEEIVNPEGIESQVPEYYRHYARVNRVVNLDGGGNPYATWVRTGDDHYVHADIYCRAAMELLGPVADGETSTMLTGGGERGRTVAIPGEQAGWEEEDDEGNRKSAWQ